MSRYMTTLFAYPATRETRVYEAEDARAAFAKALKDFPDSAAQLDHVVIGISGGRHALYDKDEMVELAQGTLIK